jgi:hypothetical protein
MSDTHAAFAVKIGINPISWSNDDLPSLGGETPLSTALSEGREIGYQGFELGNKFPKDPAALRELTAASPRNRWKTKSSRWNRTSICWRRTAAR